MNEIIIAILIFCARVIDVSLGTIRIIFISKGKKFFASFLGFIEALIWLCAINQIMNGVTAFWMYIVYAAGFATGTCVGIMFEEKISIGNVLVRIITHNNPEKLIEELKSKKYTLTTMDADGRKEKVKMIYTVVPRKKLHEIEEILDNYGPKTFYTIEDVRYAKEMNYDIVKTEIDRKMNLRKKNKQK